MTKVFTYDSCQLAKHALPIVKRASPSPSAPSMQLRLWPWLKITTNYKAYWSPRRALWKAWRWFGRNSPSDLPVASIQVLIRL